MIGGDENKKRILVIGDDLTFFQSEKAIFKIPEGAVINLFLLLVTNKTGVFLPESCCNLTGNLLFLLYVLGIIGPQRDNKHK